MMLSITSEATVTLNWRGGFFSHKKKVVTLLFLLDTHLNTIRVFVSISNTIRSLDYVKGLKS